MSHSVKGECRNTGRTHFKKGFTPWNKDRTGLLSKESRYKMGSSRRGKPSPMKGKNHTPEIRKIISQKSSVSLLGNTHTKGKPWSEKRRKAQERLIKKPKTKPIMVGGKEYHPMWHELRKVVYQRDGWICQECGKHCHRDIACHHIDYDTSNNDLFNLITLCRSCHCKTNFRRENWIIHYLEKINER